MSLDFEQIHAVLAKQENGAPIKGLLACDRLIYSLSEDLRFKSRSQHIFVSFYHQFHRIINERLKVVRKFDHELELE